jgi:predicted Zn-dependent peptidase
VAVIVGDLEPERALGLVETALGGWRGAGPDLTLPPAPPLEPGPLTLVDRPGSVQSSIRLALPAVERTHPDHAALVLANLIFGGYFSSRWVENVRERKGYSYGPHSLIEHSVAGSLLTVSAEVATEVSAPAMLETWYELGRLALVPPIQAELDQARQYALGTLQLGMASQAGLASLAINYAGVGLRLPFLADHAARLAAVTRDELTAVAAAYLAPSRAAAVVLGDAAVAVDSLSRIGAVIREELDEVDSEPAYGAPAGRDDRTERGADHGAGSGGDNDRTGSGADERRTGTAAVSRADDSGP